MTEKVEQVQFLIFWFLKIYATYKMLFFKTVTFTENVNSLNKELTFVTAVCHVVRSFFRSTVWRPVKVPQVSKYFNLNARIFIGVFKNISNI